MAEISAYSQAKPASFGALLRYSAASGAAALIVLGLDQLTKWLARIYLPPLENGSIPVVGDVFRLTYVLNRGAAFGVLQNQNALFIVVSGIVIAVIIGSYRYSSTRSRLLNLALGLQLGGAIGNLIDRVRLGYVVDFLDVRLPSQLHPILGMERWPVFNVADSAIVMGVAILALHLLVSPSAGPPAPQTEPGESR
ncbi:MAG: signal peptidase II [Chloroflexi bacterium]|nr:signal peptidase II [Chloroflexota bacterium]